MTENGTTPLGQPPDSTLTVSEALTVLAHGVQRLRLRDGVTFGGARDTYAILGYPQEISYPEYYAKYHRGGLAKTIVDAFVETTWRQPPTVREVGKPDERRRRRLKRRGRPSSSDSSCGGLFVAWTARPASATLRSSSWDCGDKRTGRCKPLQSAMHRISCMCRRLAKNIVRLPRS